MFLLLFRLQLSNAVQLISEMQSLKGMVCVMHCIAPTCGNLNPDRQLVHPRGLLLQSYIPAIICPPRGAAAYPASQIHELLTNSTNYSIIEVFTSQR